MYCLGMNNQDVIEWLEKWGLRPEYLAAISGISFSTLTSGLRGARWSKKTEAKIRSSIAQYERDQNNKKAS